MNIHLLICVFMHIYGVIKRINMGKNEIVPTEDYCALLGESLLLDTLMLLIIISLLDN